MTLTELEACLRILFEHARRRNYVAASCDFERDSGEGISESIIRPKLLK